MADLVSGERVDPESPRLRTRQAVKDVLHECGPMPTYALAAEVGRRTGASKTAVQQELLKQWKWGNMSRIKTEAYVRGYRTWVLVDVWGLVS